jgi:metal-sulfur cluster biosynthetic enzyme
MTGQQPDPGAEVTAEDVYQALSEVTDPELPISVVDLGLIYDVRLVGTDVEIDMTLTSTGCPVHDLLVEDVRAAVAALDGVSETRVSVVWDPPWTSDRIAMGARRLLATWGIGS